MFNALPLRKRCLKKAANNIKNPTPSWPRCFLAATIGNKVYESENYANRASSIKHQVLEQLCTTLKTLCYYGCPSLFGFCYSARAKENSGIMARFTSNN